MFDWFKKDKTSNVIPFPERKEDYITPELPKEENPARVFYRLGVTDKNRLAFQMGYSEITMTREGVQNLINQLEVFRDQLIEDVEDDLS
jgi:hypothetical protein